LDTAERLLLREGKPVQLTPKAFETLVALVERNGHLVEKEELMRLVWADACVEESNLTNNVAAIRKLLGRGKSGRNYIETVPKRGYRFTAAVKELSPEALVVEKRTLTRVVTEEQRIDRDSPRQTLIGAGEAIDRPADLAAALARTPEGSPTARTWGLLFVALLSVSLIITGLFIYRSLRAAPRQIESIAVLPFKNESGNPDVEYLSDGVTETLINSLSQISNLSVKARSTVFHYKVRAVEPQAVAAELSVQAIVTGRVVQRGEYLTFYLSLVDGRTGNQIWGRQYDRTLADLVSLQSEIARDVSLQLRARLSAGDEQKLAKKYTENVEAYQLYLKGMFHVRKMKPQQVTTGIGLFEQAIEHDSSYALAYVGLSNAYRALALSSGEMRPTEFLPKAKAEANKAIELDDTLAEAHASLSANTFWYDWDWRAAEKQCKRALELDSNHSGAHAACAHVFLITGRHAEALAEIKRARELEPTELRINALEGMFLNYAGQTDQALARLQNAYDLDANFWLAHAFASSAYIDKGMFAEAAAEARKATELSGASTWPTAHLGYALAKSGKKAEAETLLKELLKAANERYIPPYHIAFVYNGLGEHNKALEWLERGVEQRDTKMVFLGVESKWNNIRDDPRFQNLLKRIGLK
jgi:TolB-like protein/DNA-binding winged helix-turn-helix (wHTH) protein/Flp pilus assembly protein TadD